MRSELRVSRVVLLFLISQVEQPHGRRVLFVFDDIGRVLALLHLQLVEAGVFRRGEQQRIVIEPLHRTDAPLEARDGPWFAAARVDQLDLRAAPPASHSWAAQANTHNGFMPDRSAYQVTYNSWITGGAMNRAAILMILAAAIAAGADVSQDGPQYTADGQLTRPQDYREWVFLSSGLGMTYGPLAAPGEPRFDNVFASRAAYRTFLKTGHWPDKTMLVLEVRASEGKGSINQGGHFQSGVVGVEVHVKDEKRFARKWAFFGFRDGQASAKAIPESSNCFTCHEQHGAVDTTFVQFYPTLIPAAKQKGTFAER